VDIANKLIELFLGISVTGLFSAIVWLLKWCDKLDLQSHDLRRDVAHLQRNGQTISQAIAEQAIQDEAKGLSVQKSFNAIDRRMVRVEKKLYVIEVRVNGPGAIEKPEA
jgi:hypothetical protein